MLEDCCSDQHIVGINAKCSDMFTATSYGPDDEQIQHTGYVPIGLGIGAGDYIRFSYCTGCGKIVGEWPIAIEDVDAILKGE